MVRATFVAVILCLSALPLQAQNREADERTLRALIAAGDAGQVAGVMLDDGISWSGAYKQPRYGRNDKQTPIDATRTQNWVKEPDGRWKQQQQTTVRKLDIAQSGDMAYEVSDINFTMQLQTPKGVEPDQFTTTTLRVWKKIDGKWRLAASFNMGHDSTYPNPNGPRGR